MILQAIAKCLRCAGLLLWQWADRRQSAVYGFFLPFIFSPRVPENRVGLFKKGAVSVALGDTKISMGGYHAIRNRKTAGG